MKTLFKIIAAIVALLLIAVVCIALYFRFVFDPNDLREQITKQVQAKTGRALVIEGDLKISTFPWLSAQIGRTTLSDDPAFGSKPLLAFDSASASIKLMPLLKRQLELGTTTIDGGNIKLTRLADGTTNWGLLLDKLAGDEPAPAASTGSGYATQSLGAIKITNGTVVFNDELPGAGFQTLTLSAFNLSTGELKPGAPFGVDLATRLDATNVGLDVTLTAMAQMTETYLGLEISNATLNGNHYAVPFEQFSVDMATDSVRLGETTVDMGAGSIDWRVSKGRDAAKDLGTGSGTVKLAAFSLNGERFALAEPDVSFDLEFTGGAVKALEGKLNADAISNSGEQIDFKLPALTFDATALDGSFAASDGKVQAKTLTLDNGSQLAAGEVVLSTKLSGKAIGNSPQSVKATLDSLALNLDSGALNISQYVAEGFGLKGRGALTGTNVMDAATLNGPVTLQPFNLRTLLTSMDIELDTADKNALSTAEGSATVRYTPNGLELRDLKAKVDQSNVTGLIKLTGKTPEVSLSIDALTLDGYMSPPDNIEGEKRAVDTIELPAQTLRDLNLNGQLRIGALNLGGIKSSNVEVQMAATDGNVRIYPARAQLYGGTYSGDMQLNAQGEVPKVSLNESFNDVDFGAFSQALAGSQKLSGRVTGSLKMTASGHNTRDLKATSNGSVAFAFKDGVLDGINVMETVRNIVATANKEPRVPDEPNKTPFRKMEGTATIDQGVLTNKDLAIDIPLMRINGQGTLNLNTKAINYRVGARVVQEGDVPLEKELRFISDYTLPLVIGGTYEEPKVDVSGSIADLAAQYAKKRIQDKLLDKLGLGTKTPAPPAQPVSGTPAPPAEPGTGAPAQPVLTPEEEAKLKKEQLKDELDRKLKDKLKDLLGDG